MGWQLDVRVDAAMLRAQLADDVANGLGTRPRSLPPKYFYDAVGSQLFEEITTLPEYYLTRAELALLRARGPEILAAIEPAEIVELGAGPPTKISILLRGEGGGGVARYVPVDVDADGVDAAARRLVREHPRLEVHGLVGDFERHLAHVPPAVGRRLVAVLGSTIGNLHQAPRRALLERIRELIGADGAFLLGVDLVKDRARLESAYDDAAGVTAEFNRNVLRVVNRGLDADFRPEAFRHHAFYDVEAARIEMHLMSLRRQTVRVRAIGLEITLEPHETIWTEASYKFTRASVEAMFAEAGLRLERWLTPPDDSFALALARPIAA